MSARLVQNVVNQVVVASSSSAAEAWVEESSELDVASELELSVLELSVLELSVLEPELVEAAATVFAGAAVPLPELQPATSNPPAASTLIQDERFNCHSLSVPAPHRPGSLGLPPAITPHGDGRGELRLPLSAKGRSLGRFPGRDSGETDRCRARMSEQGRQRFA